MTCTVVCSSSSKVVVIVVWMLQLATLHCIMCIHDILHVMTNVWFMYFSALVQFRTGLMTDGIKHCWCMHSTGSVWLCFIPSGFGPVRNCTSAYFSASWEVEADVQPTSWGLFSLCIVITEKRIKIVIIDNDVYEASYVHSPCTNL